MPDCSKSLGYMLMELFGFATHIIPQHTHKQFRAAFFGHAQEPGAQPRRTVKLACGTLGGESGVRPWPFPAYPTGWGVLRVCQAI